MDNQTILFILLYPMFIRLPDQTGHEVVLQRKPERIVSLVPSKSEYLWELGLQKELVGITKFCIHPPELFERVTRVGGTKNVRLDAIERLAPDLIIANKEENTQSDIMYLRERFPVYTSDIIELDDAYRMLLDIGQLTGQMKKADHITNTARKNLATIKGAANGKKVAYLIWQDPYMAAGGHTFINTLLQHSGFINVFSQTARYPAIHLSDIAEAQPEYLFLSTEPFPFTDKHVRAMETEWQHQFPDHPITIKIADGEAFSWYGSRLTQFHEYLQEFILNL